MGDVKRMLAQKLHPEESVMWPTHVLPSSSFRNPNDDLRSTFLQRFCLFSLRYHFWLDHFKAIFRSSPLFSFAVLIIGEYCDHT